MTDLLRIVTTLGRLGLVTNLIDVFDDWKALHSAVLGAVDPQEREAIKAAFDKLRGDIEQLVGALARSEANP
jgi:hypothetical protein